MTPQMHPHIVHHKILLHSIISCTPPRM